MSKLITLENLATFKEQIDVLIGDSFAANDAMVFKGTLGTSGTVTALPTSGYSAGWTYKVITAGTYAGYTCEVGDLVIAVSDYGTAFANSDWTVAQSNLEVTSSISGSSKVPTDAAVKSFVEGKGYLTTQTQLSKGAEANTTETLKFGGTFTAMSDTSVSNHQITDNTVTYTMPSETTLSTGSATDSKSTSHGGTFTAVTGISVSGHTITPTVTTYTLPSDNNTDTKVTQTVTTTDAKYPLLATNTASKTASSTDTARFAAAVTLNPSEGSITATKFIGDLTGNADTATSATTATTATTATKLGSSDVGSATQPIYLNDGVATACTYTLAKSVPSNAVFTDTDTKVTQTVTTGDAAYPILTTATASKTSTSTEGARFAAGVTLNPSAGSITATKFVGDLTGNADTATTATTATSATTATTATKLGSSTVGSATQPIYLNAGTATKCTYTLGKSVPSDAVFTDTNTKVTQTVTTTDAEYPLLATNTASATSTATDTARFASGVTLNPADGTITASGGFIGDLTGNADTATSATTATTATTATKLGSSTVGGTAKPIYLNAGAPTACSSTVGSGTKPVYMNSGTITASSSTVGSGVKPVYMSSGTITASSSTVGSGIKPVYMSSGSITVSGSTVGGAAAPVYLNAGTITACSVATEDDITALFA